MKNGKTYYVNEDITFTAIGSWPHSTTCIQGDEYYVPLNWHHADPSGGWGGKDDSFFTCSATFKQAATGKYTIKVKFQSYTHNGTTWEADGIVTVACEYRCTAPSATPLTQARMSSPPGRTAGNKAAYLLTDNAPGGYRIRPYDGNTLTFWL